MSYRARMQASPETVAEFERAWELRMAEGLRLLEDEKTSTGGVYLLGYVAEMILKVAYFRFIGAASEDRLDVLFAATDFKNAVKNMNMDTEGFHSLLFWMELLLITRGQNKRRLPKTHAGDLRGYTATLYANWKVEMRYRSLTVAAQEWRDVKEAAIWFHKNHDSLWR